MTGFRVSTVIVFSWRPYWKMAAINRLTHLPMLHQRNYFFLYFYDSNHIYIYIYITTQTFIKTATRIRMLQDCVQGCFQCPCTRTVSYLKMFQVWRHSDHRSVKIKDNVSLSSFSKDKIMADNPWPAVNIESSPVWDTSFLAELIYDHIIIRQFVCGKCPNPVTIQYLRPAVF